MAYGTELVLPLPDAVLRDLAGTDAPEPDELDSSDPDVAAEARYNLIWAADDAVKPQLRRIHEQLIRDRFDLDAYWSPASAATRTTRSAPPT